MTAEKILTTLIEVWAEQNGLEVQHVEFNTCDDSDDAGGVSPGLCCGGILRKHNNDGIALETSAAV